LINKEIYIKELRDLLKKSHKNTYYSEVCIKYAEQLLNNKLPVIFDLKHLSLLIGIDTNSLVSIVFSQSLYYQEISIPKKSGGFRTLYCPAIVLKYIQRWILDNILMNIKISDFATGFCPKRSIMTNACFHKNKDCLLNMDIKDFFPTISFDKVFKVFIYFGYTKEVSFFLAKLCTYKNQLPQGSPASPYLSNIICLKLDRRLLNLAETYEASYSRYADDITFSGNCGIRNCKKIIAGIVEEEGFVINEKKTRIAYRYQRQEVTGLIVNGNKIRVNKKYKRRLYQEIYYCKKYGVGEHLSKIKMKKSFYKEYLYGKAYYINMVEKEEAKKIFSLLEQINWDY